jgi:branched-chain amino acid aminotransferase
MIKTEFNLIPHPAPITEKERSSILKEPGFGRYFTDHMLVMRWEEGRGWHGAEIRQRQAFSIDPANAILHYGQEIFEGLKAYRASDGRILLFRPEQNAKRFAESATRMAMPALPTELFVRAIEALVTVDRNWIPTGDASLYIRPFMFADDVFLGVRPARAYQFCIIASPAGAYFKSGGKAVTVWVEDEYTRAGYGGTGAAKCGGNYAASLAAQAKAIKHDCDQVIFLDAAERRWIEELGGMNIFFVTSDGSLITPPVDGTILRGITRASVMTLARQAGRRIDERKISFEEFHEGVAANHIVEAFACGTAAVIAGIGRVRTAAGDFIVGNGSTGPVTEQLRNQLVAIQRGEVSDENEWLYEIGGTS